MANVKVYIALARNPSITAQYFHDYWRHPHSTWGMGIAGKRHYVQSHRIDTALLPETQTMFDGIAEVWFDAADDATNYPNDPVYRTRLAPDEPHFIDMSQVRVFFAEEEVLMWGPDGRHRTDGEDVGWIEQDRPVTTKLIQFFAPDDGDWAGEDDLALGKAIGALRHVRSHPVGRGRTAHAFASGVRELWWPTLTAFETGVAAAPDAWRTILRNAHAPTGILANAERYL